MSGPASNIIRGAFPDGWKPVEEGGNGGVVYGGRASRKAAPDYAGMPDGDLDAAIRVLETESEVIKADLAFDADEGNPKGEGWRRSAGKALSYRVAFLALARKAKEARQAKQAASRVRVGPTAEEIAAWEDIERAKAERREAERAARLLKAEQKRRALAEQQAAHRAAVERKRVAKEEARARHEALLAEHAKRKGALDAMRVEHRAGWEAHDGARARLFVAAARKVLPKETLAAIWAEVERDNPGAPEMAPWPSLKEFVERAGAAPAGGDHGGAFAPCRGNVEGAEMGKGERA